ncbi:uncharacterized protein TNCV_4829271 [Trichonephila clavipes]|nr:uncharacterized protein TNCV_4829271 [Trichonephila clavipes]
MARIVGHNDESVREGYIRNDGKEVKMFTSALKAFQCITRIVMTQRKHLDDFLRDRIIGKLEYGRTQLEVSEELGIAQNVISGFGNDSKMMVMRVDVTTQVAPDLQRRTRTGIWQLLPKKQTEHSI